MMLFGQTTIQVTAIVYKLSSSLYVFLIAPVITQHIHMFISILSFVPEFVPLRERIVTNGKPSTFLALG